MYVEDVKDIVNTLKVASEILSRHEYGVINGYNFDDRILINKCLKGMLNDLDEIEFYVDDNYSVSRFLKNTKKYIDDFQGRWKKSHLANYGEIETRISAHLRPTPPKELTVAQVFKVFYHIVR